MPQRHRRLDFGRHCLDGLALRGLAERGLDPDFAVLISGLQRDVASDDDNARDVAAAPLFLADNARKASVRMTPLRQ